MARPRKKPLPDNSIQLWASKGCTDGEIVTLLKSVGIKTDADDVRRRAGDALDLGRAQMRRRIREVQLNLVEGEKPNPIMLIWLGKQYLGQADKVEANNRQILQIQSEQVWQSAFGTVGGRSVPVSKRVAEGEKPPQAVN